MTVLNATTASEYDFVILADASGSMGEPSLKDPTQTRWQEMQESALAFTREIEQYDADGLDIGFFGPDFSIEEGVTVATLRTAFANRRPQGSTPLIPALQWVAQKQKTSGKKTVAIIFTDGEPDNKGQVPNIITEISKGLTADEDLTYLFIQIGDNAAARNYLDNLDNNLSSAKFDIVDVVSLDESNTLAPLDLINKAIAD